MSDVDALARETLLRLVESGTLRPARRGSLTAFELWYLPEHVRLSVPPTGAWTDLYDPRTRGAAALALAERILALATMEERDGWVVSSSRLRLTVTPASEARPSAEVGLEADGPWTLPPADGRALARLTFGTSAETLCAGDGLASIESDGAGPRLVLVEAEPGEGGPIALVSDRAFEFAADDGVKSRVAAHQRHVAGTSGQFLVPPAAWQRWRREVTGRLELLVQAVDAAAFELEIGEPPIMWPDGSDEALVVELPGGGTVALQATDGVVELRNRTHATAFARWCGDAWLRLPPKEAVPVCPQDLRGLAAGMDVEQLVAVRRIRGDEGEPVHITVHGRGLPPGRVAAATLMGFQDTAAVIEFIGLAFDRTAPSRLEFVVASTEMAGPLFAVRIDRSLGCKVLVQSALAEAGGLADAWEHVLGSRTLGERGAAIRINGGRLVHAEPMVPIVACRLTRDRSDAFERHGWRLSMVGASLNLQKIGDETVCVGTEILSESRTLPPRDEYEVRLGAERYRVRCSAWTD